MVKNILRSDVLMSDFQREHHKRNFDLVQKTEGLGTSVSIKEDIELSSRSDVSFAHSTTHDHNLLNLLQNLWIYQEQDAEICQ